MSRVHPVPQRRSHGGGLQPRQVAQELTIKNDGCFAINTAGGRPDHHWLIMSSGTRILLYIYSRYVPMVTICGQLANCSCKASMFCKSCNCNSSIATRIGFAVRLLNEITHEASVLILSPYSSSFFSTPCWHG